jgi:hypothetical protein
MKKRRKNLQCRHCKKQSRISAQPPPVPRQRLGESATSSETSVSGPVKSPGWLNKVALLAQLCMVLQTIYRVIAWIVQALSAFFAEN